MPMNENSNVHTELTLLRAQMERVQSAVLAGAQQTTPPGQGGGGTDAPPPYTVLELGRFCLYSL
jgi:hypothetical protein